MGAGEFGGGDSSTPSPSPRGAGSHGYAVVRVLLGLLLLTAARLKAHQLATEPVFGSGLLDNRWLLMVEVELELAFGLWLLAGLAPKWTWRAAVLCFAGFACITLAKGLAGETTCGCFGRVEVSPWYTLVLDLAAVAALLCWSPNGRGLRGWRPRSDHGTVPFGRVVDGDKGTVPSGSPSPGLRLATVAVLWLVMGMPAAWAMASYRPATVDPSGAILGDGQFVVLEPEQWIGKPFPLLDYIDIGDRLAEGEWIVVLYRHDCLVCQEAIPAYEQRARGAMGRPRGSRMALVDMIPGDSTAQWLVTTDSPCLCGRISGTRRWFLATPTELVLSRGVVSRVRSG